VVFSSLVKPNALAVLFRPGVLFYKALEVLEEFAFLRNRVGFSYLRIVIKEYNLVSALIISYNGKGTSNIGIDKFKRVGSRFDFSFI